MVEEDGFILSKSFDMTESGESVIPRMADFVWSVDMAEAKKAEEFHVDTLRKPGPPS